MAIEPNLPIKDKKMESAAIAQAKQAVDTFIVRIGDLASAVMFLIGTAALGMFIALYNAMQERRYDLVIMRSLGATRGTLLRQVFLEGLIMAGVGTALGVVLGHAVTGLLGQLLPEAKAMGLSGVVWLSEEWYLFLLAGAVGIAATALPAAQAYRADIAVTLASR